MTEVIGAGGAVRNAAFAESDVFSDRKGLLGALASSLSKVRRKCPENTSNIHVVMCAPNVYRLLTQLTGLLGGANSATFDNARESLHYIPISRAQLKPCVGMVVYPWK